MNKSKMAHDWFMKHATGNPTFMITEVELSWNYADLMQAEADKREDKTRPAVLSGSVHPTVMSMNEFSDACVKPNLEEWQPDWSQAPDNAKYWAMDKDHTANFFKNKPEITNGNGWDFGGVMQSNNSHSYQGNWQDSLRKRPENGFKRYYGDGLECAR